MWRGSKQRGRVRGGGRKVLLQERSRVDGGYEAASSRWPVKPASLSIVPFLRVFDVFLLPFVVCFSKEV